MNFETWLTDLIGDDTRRTASSKTGMSESTLSRQLSRGTLRPEMVIALCRAYDRSPVTGLIETGYLQEWETDGVGIPYALHQATNQQLLDEIMRRSDPEARALFTAEYDDTVVDLTPADELAAKRASPQPTPTPTPVREWEAVDAALTDEEHQLIDAGRAPDLHTLADLEAWRATRTDVPAPPDDGTVYEWDDRIPHAADSSPDEDALREEYGEDPID